MNPKQLTLYIQANGGLYKRIKLDTSQNTAGWLVKSSIFDPSAPTVELATPTTTLSTYSAGEDNIITASLDPSLLAAELVGTRTVLGWELQLDPGLGYFITVSAGDVLLTTGGSA